VANGARGDLPRLSLAEWMVLALIAEEPRHGFAVAALAAPDGPVGQAWHIPRPIVYRAIATLTELGLTSAAGTEQGSRGPQRTVVAATAEGTAAVRRWLRRPVEHLRDTRSELLVKFALLERRGWSPGPLVTAQRTVFTRREAELRAQVRDTDGFERLVLTWRLESARAALRFLDQVRPSRR
jgi:PadR family transcriptional regulator AphA